MAITYVWSFPQFDCAPSEDGLTDVVKTVHWRLQGTDGQFSSGAYGTVALAAPSPDAFIPFDQITEQWAVNVVVGSEGFDLAEIEAAIAGNIAAQSQPSVIPLPAPFA